MVTECEIVLLRVIAGHPGWECSLKYISQQMWKMTTRGSYVSQGD